MEKTKFSALMCVFAGVLLLNQLISAQVKINEFLADNVSVNPDNTDYDDFSDWVELYNGGSAEANVGGYYLTGDLKQTKKWQIPTGTTIPSKGYLLIWCDDNNAKPGTSIQRDYYNGKTETAKRYHAAFMLAKDGEQVGLFTSTGTVVDSVTFPKQFSDVSMGRDGDGKWVYFDEPTPEAANTTPIKGRADFAGMVTFSVAGGFYTSAQTVTLTASDNSPIYYTTDCSIPFTGDTKYTGPISVSKTTIIRARCIPTDKYAGKVATNTYFVNDKARKLMVISITSEPAYLFDETIGIYKNSRKGFEVPASVEFFTPDGKPAVKANAGVRLGSLTNFQVAQKPLQIALRNRYGDPYVDYQFYAKPITKFDRFRLRDGGDVYNSSIINDALLDPLCSNQTAVGIQALRVAVVYINGEYYGIQDLREQFKDMYFSENYGIANPEKRDEVRSILLPSTGFGGFGKTTFGSSGEGWELVSGTWDTRKTLVNLVKSGTMDAAKYTQFKNLVDIASMSDFFILIHFAVAISWGHNQDMWTAAGQKWRWLVTDFDRGFLHEDALSSVESNMFASAFGVSPKLSDDTLFKPLLTNTEFKNYFKQRYAAHLNSTLKPARCINIVDSIAAIYKLDMTDHVAKWGKIDGVRSVSAWETEVASIKKFFTDRPGFVWEQLEGTPFSAASGRAGLTVKLAPNDAQAEILINGVPMSQGLSGISLFKGIPFTVKAVGKPGWKCSGWSTGGSSDSATVTLSGDQTITANFETAATSPDNVPSEFRINGITAYPVASNGRITLQLNCSLKESGQVTVALYNLAGQRIEKLLDGNLSAGMRRMALQSKTCPAGVYYYRITSGSINRTGKISIQ